MVTLESTETIDPKLQARRPLGALSVFGFLDAALGRAGGDDAAIAVVGRDSGGGLWLLDVWMAPEPPHRQIAEVFALHERWGFVQFAVEANCFQSMIRDELARVRHRRERAGADVRFGLVPVVQRQAKAQRIAALEPLLAHGWLRVNRAVPQPFLEQVAQYPLVAHDDGLDAVAGAVALARAAGARLAPGTSPTAHRPRGTW